jgi:hypothetical protein
MRPMACTSQPVLRQVCPTVVRNWRRSSSSRKVASRRSPRSRRTAWETRLWSPIPSRWLIQPRATVVRGRSHQAGGPEFSTHFHPIFFCAQVESGRLWWNGRAYRGQTNQNAAEQSSPSGRAEWLFWRVWLGLGLLEVLVYVGTAAAPLRWEASARQAGALRGMRGAA